MGKRESAADAAANETVVSEEQVTYTRRRATADVHRLHRSPLNYRKRIDDAKLEELAASIRRLGVLEPLLVRERPDEPDEYDVIAGERRWRATLRVVDEMPERAELEVIVINVDDATALEIMVTENTQREDPHPLDECDGFVRLRDDFGRTPEQIAAKISRPVRYVYERLRLETLCAEGREAMFEGRFGIGVGLALARIASSKLQAKATKELLQQHQLSEVPIEAARRWVRDRYMLRLAQAPFSTSDADLVPSAGACSSCPKRTGADKQGELFGDAEHGRDDMCTDAPCWEGKKSAAWEKLAAEASSQGVRVLSTKESEKILPTSWGGPRAGYVDLDQPEYSTTAQKTWRQTLGKKRLAGVEVVLARDAEGKPRQLAKRDELVKAVRTAPSSKDPEALLHDAAGESAKGRDEARLAREIEEESHRRVIGALVQAIEGGGSKNNLDFWRAFAAVMIEDSADCESPTDPAKRRGLITSDELAADEPADEKLMKAAAEMDAAQLLGLIVEVVAWRKIYDVRSEKGKPTPLGSLLDALNINRKHHEREAAKAVKVARKSKEGSVAKSATKKKSRAELDAEEAESKRERMEDAYAE